MTHPDYGRAFAAWRAACPQDWHDYMHHDFVEGLRTGDLPREGFMNYLCQDYVFLVNFARAWSLAVTKAGTLQEMKAASAVVYALVQGEMALHVGICEAEGITQDQLLATVEANANLAYTRYVLESGYSGDFLDLLAALIPCVMGYGEIGMRLAPYAATSPYRKWIETYAGEGYQQTCREAGELIDGAIARRLGDNPEALPRWNELARRFATATRLEVGFWGLGMPQNEKPRVVSKAEVTPAE